VKKLLGCDALHTLLPRSSENDRQIDSTNVAALKQPKISLTGDFMSTSNTISKIGAVSYIIWACLHLLAVYSVYVLGSVIGFVHGARTSIPRCNDSHGADGEA